MFVLRQSLNRLRACGIRGLRSSNFHLEQTKTNTMSNIGTACEQHTASNHGYRAAEYERHPDHVANTGQEEESYVLALVTDEPHPKYLTGLRTEYFPARINKLEAHIALFRALPGSQLAQITQDLEDVTKTHGKFRIVADRPFRLGHGIGINVQKSEAEAVFNDLKSRWSAFLSKQDRSFNAHYTIQNKVDDAKEVDRSLEQLRAQFHCSEGTVEGLGLYRYVKGFWKDRRDFLFKDSSI